MSARAVKEWIGKTPDTRPPDHVVLRIFDRHDQTCHWSKRKIRPGEAWDVDHVKALVNGGENRESNMAPILRGKPHNDKTAVDVAEKSRVYRKRAAHFGLKASRQKIKSAGFAKAPSQRRASTPVVKWRGF